MKDQYAHFFKKPIPKSVLVFGAAGRLGGPVARFLNREAPSIRLRLSTSHPEKVAGLQKQFPNAEVVVSNYMDLPSMVNAVDGMEGIFCVTNGSVDETQAMGNLVAAIKKSATLIHMIRQVGLTPDMSQHRLPDYIKTLGRGLPIDHPKARKILDDADLPVTYLNTGASFMSNFAIWFSPAIKKDRKLIWPERRVPYIDTDEAGEIAARLLLSNDRRYVGHFLTINNGSDFMTFEECAAMMSDVWGETITYDSSKASYFSEYAAMGEARLKMLLLFFDFERSIEVLWSLNDCAERILGRKPKTLREWFIENKEQVFGE